MYCGIQLVSKKLEDWKIDDLVDFLYQNANYLRENSFGLHELAGDMDTVARNLRIICEDNEAADRIRNLEFEVEGLEDDCSSHELTISDLEEKIAELEEQLADNEA